MLYLKSIQFDTALPLEMNSHSFGIKSAIYMTTDDENQHIVDVYINSSIVALSTFLALL